MWTLHVEDFGRIEKADITVSPLTLFVGDNNSGKSYLLSLIYGLLCADDVLSDLCEDSDEYRACAAWAEKVLEQGREKVLTQGKQVGDAQIPFDDYAYTIFENLFNRILESNQKDILRSIFNADISARKISVTFPQGDGETLQLIFEQGKLGSLNLSFAFLMAFVNTMAQSAKGNIEAVISVVLKGMLIRGFSHLHELFNIVFLPTTRSGLLLTYKALAKDAFSRAYNLNQKLRYDLLLARPFTDFLGNLATVNSERSYPKHEFIVRFMEDNIIHGRVIVSNDMPLPDFYYIPEKSEISLPMFLSSDVVKQMTPLLAILKHQTMDALFIEEPEMSLHLELQQMMARALIKLANAGMPVIAATHSDTILQHVNNMIKLHNLPAARKQTLMERFQLDADDPISADKISMYQFDVQDNGKTVVQALKCGDYGFEVPTFYDPLETLLEQTRATEPDAEEYED